MNVLVPRHRHLYAASDYAIENATALNPTLVDEDIVDLDVVIFEPFGLPVTNGDSPSDSVNLNPRVDSLMLDGGMELSIVGEEGPQGPGSLGSYTVLFPLVVPEPGSALLMGLGVIGAVIFGRPRSQTTT